MVLLSQFPAQDDYLFLWSWLIYVYSIIVNAPKDPQEAFPNPVLQCVQIRPMNAAPQAGAPDRYRIVLSDIDQFSQGMLATRWYPSKILKVHL